MVCLEGGRLSEDLADFLPDYRFVVRPASTSVITPQGVNCGQQPPQMHHLLLDRPSSRRPRLAFEGGGGADSGGHFYVCDRTAELNEHFGDLLHKIQDLEVPTCDNICQSTV